MHSKPWVTLAITCLALALSFSSKAQTILGEEPALGSIESRITQAEIVSGALSLADLRFAGLKMFATQFRKADGYGDGPMNPTDTTSPGGHQAFGPATCP